MHKALAHNAGDHVAVAVDVIAAGEEIVVVYLDESDERTVLVHQDVPYGHKVALDTISAGAPVIEYGVQVAVASAEIAVGDYVHTHNVKTARW